MFPTVPPKDKRITNKIPVCGDNPKVVWRNIVTVDNVCAMRNSNLAGFIKPKAFGIALGIIVNAASAGAAEALDNWEEMAPSQFNSLFSGVTFGHNQFVAVGADGIVGTSSDGFTWIPQSHG